MECSCGCCSLYLLSLLGFVAAALPAAAEKRVALVVGKIDNKIQAEKMKQGFPGEPADERIKRVAGVHTFLVHPIKNIA